MLDTLPVELIEQLLGYVSLSDRLQLTMVSKRLYNVFWRSPVGANLRKGIKFLVERIDHIQDLVSSRIFQMNAINEVLLDFQQICDQDMDHFVQKWDLLAPQLISLTILHDRPLDVFRLFKYSPGLVTLNWTYRPFEEPYKGLPPAFSQDLDAVDLHGLKHLTVDTSIPKTMFTKFLEEFLSIVAAKSRLASLTLWFCDVDFDGLPGLVRPHAASLKYLKISYSSISGEQLISLGSVPDLQLLHLDISCCSNISLESFIRFLRLQPNLVSLNIDGCEEAFFADEPWDTFKNEFSFHLSGLKSLTMRPGSSPKFSDFIPKLRHLQQLICLPVSWDAPLAPSLNKNSCTLRKAEFCSEDVFLLHDDHLRNLRDITLFGHGSTDMPNSNNEVYSRVWQHCHNLEALNIMALRFEADGPMAASCNNLRKLTDLSMDLMMPNGWTDSLGFLLKLPNLRRLRVCFRMSSLSVKDFLEFNRRLASKTPFLEDLRLFDIPNEDIFQIQATEYTKLWPRMKVALLI